MSLLGLNDSFHNESHHPYVYFMVYSAKENDGFLTGPAIVAMRYELAYDIIRQDFTHIYEQQNEDRSSFKKGATNVMAELLVQMQARVCKNKAIEVALLLLSNGFKTQVVKRCMGISR